jgi:hypothetical protein
MKTKIYGASDDLIEIEGAISEELDCYDEKLKLVFSDGTVIETKYDHGGQWRLKVLEVGSKLLRHVPAVGDDQVHIEEHSEEVPNYSDFIILDDGIEWMKIKNRKYKAVADN